MRKKPQLKRVVSILLLAAMLLTLCGCGGRGGKSPEKESVSEEGGEETEPTARVVEGIAQYHEDPTILAHVEHNQNIQVVKPAERQATEFRFYITNNKTMEGFVTSGEINAYHNSIQSIFDAAHSQYDQHGNYSAWTLDYPEGSRELTWCETDFDNSLLHSISHPNFYARKELSENGPLGDLFDQQNPFAENALTVIVTNFVEPYFDLNALAGGIEAYFDAYDQSAACIVGMRSNYGTQGSDGNPVGTLYIPRQIPQSGSNTFYIDNFNGEIPYYVVVVGPKTAVENYYASLTSSLTSRNVPSTGCVYTNTVYEEIISPVLDFDVLPDYKTKKATAPVYSSYNTGEFTALQNGNAYFTTYSSVETSDGRGSSGISQSTQIALMTANYNGAYTYDHEVSVYAYDDASSSWVDAGKNAVTKVNVQLAGASGPLVDYGVGDNVVLLAQGRQEAYLGVTLDFSDSAILSRDTTYRVEVRLRLDHADPNSISNSVGSLLPDYSVTSAQYYDLKLSPLSNGNYIWTGGTLGAGAREQALHNLARTPNLEALLTRMAELEKKYQDNTETVQYLDFIFNMPSGNSKR